MDYLRRIVPAFKAALGSASAQGELDRLDTVELLKRDWGIYQGRFGARPSTREIAEFLEHQYGTQLSGIDRTGRTLSRSQLDQLWEQIAIDLLRQGAVDFGGARHMRQEDDG